MAVTALIVDDSATARQIIGYHIRRVGCRIVGEAGTAADALRLLREVEPNIITLDLILPVRDGIDSLSLLRTARREAPGIAIIVVSVIPSEKVRQDFIHEGAFEYVIKPFTEYTLGSMRLKLKRAFPELTLQ